MPAPSTLDHVWPNVYSWNWLKSETSIDVRYWHSSDDLFTSQWIDNKSLVSHKALRCLKKGRLPMASPTTNTSKPQFRIYHWHCMAHISKQHFPDTKETLVNWDGQTILKSGQPGRCQAAVAKRLKRWAIARPFIGPGHSVRVATSATC